MIRWLSVAAVGMASSTFACTSLLGDFSAVAAVDGGLADSTTGPVLQDASLVDGDATSPDATGCGPGQLTCSTGCVSATDIRNCGSCGNDCTSLPRVVAVGISCGVGGICSYACLPGYGHCSTNPEDGCETDLTATAHCGSCTTVCGGDTAICGPVDNTSGCVSGCPANAATLCGGSCADLSSNDNHCGDCDTVCTGGTTCQSGKCACPAPQTSCGDTCRSTQADPAHCGASCTSCPSSAHGTATCASGVCGATCSAGFSACGGATPCAFDTTSDPSHCGASCTQCAAASPVCLNGSCVACTPGEQGCSAASNAPETCGTGGTWNVGAACTAGTTCSGISCTCASPKTMCSTCTDTNFDQKNCGSCGHSCPSNTACTNGACKATCTPVPCGTGSCGCGGMCCGTKCC